MNIPMVMEALKAESLFPGSHILAYIERLARELSCQSDGTAISYEDMYASLAARVDALPKLSLDLSVPTGAEVQYSIQLLHAMEQVADDCEAASHLVSTFESRIRDAVGKLKRVHGEFGAWYALAAQERLSGTEVRLSAPQLKQLADSEFSRLTGCLDITMESMLNAVKLLRGEIKEHKKTQMDKYSMGKDQVNASWTSHMPLFTGGGDVDKEDPGRLLREPKDSKAAAWEGIEDDVEEPEEPGEPVELKGTFKKIGDARPTHAVADGLLAEISSRPDSWEPAD